MNKEKLAAAMLALYYEFVAGDRDFATDNNDGRKWIPVEDRLPDQFVSVLGYMTDAGNFPPVRECYLVGKAFYFPALCDVHPVTHWMPLPEPPKGE